MPAPLVHFHLLDGTQRAIRGDEITELFTQGGFVQVKTESGELLATDKIEDLVQLVNDRRFPHSRPSEEEERAEAGRAYDRILEIYPRLRADYSEEEIALAFESLWALNHKVMRSPLAGGTLMAQLLRSRNPGKSDEILFHSELALKLMGF